MPIRCYWLEPTRQARLALRRYSPFQSELICPLTPGSQHDASAPLFDAVETFEYEDQHHSNIYRHAGPQSRAEVSPEHKWPELCTCGYRFVESDEWQISSEHLYRRTDTGAILTWNESGPGAMFNAEWLTDNIWYRNPSDGRSIIAKCPNGREWCIDGPARNCTMPEDPDHKCWVRHGEPPNITVDKNGKTCAAGAGSIQAGDYHGFLQAGFFT